MCLLKLLLRVPQLLNLGRKKILQAVHVSTEEHNIRCHKCGNKETSLNFLKFYNYPNYFNKRQKANKIMLSNMFLKRRINPANTLSSSER